MKAALVLKGGALVPDLAKATRYGIHRLYWEANDPQINASLFDAIRAKGFEVGIMRDPSWTNLTGSGLALKLHDDLIRLGAHAKQCAVMADIESHDPQGIIDFLTAWRKLRATRPTVWTLEPFQGGWVTPELAGKINLDPNTLVAHQNYLGSPRMFPAAADEVRTDLTRKGILSSKCVGFYDGEQVIPDRWNGIIYDLLALK